MGTTRSSSQTRAAACTTAAYAEMGVWGAWRAKPCAASRWSSASSKAHRRSAASAAQFAVSRPPCASSRRPRCAAWPARPPSRATRRCHACSARAASSAIQASLSARRWARSRVPAAGMAPRLSRWVEAAESAKDRFERIHGTALPADDHQHGQRDHTATHARLLECKPEPVFHFVYLTAGPLRLLRVDRGGSLQAFSLVLLLLLVVFLVLV